MVDDLLYHKDLPFKDLKEKILLSFIPKNVLKEFTSNETFKKEAIKLWHKRVSPMAVSYTHLDVYKRQLICFDIRKIRRKIQKNC